MGVIVNWGNEEKTILETHIDWPWTWDELAQAWNTASEMVKAVPHPVHVIAVSHTSRMPGGNFLSNVKHITRNVPKNFGLAILVTENRFQQVINTVLFQISPRLSRVGHVVSSLEAAYSVIKREGHKFQTPASVNGDGADG